MEHKIPGSNNISMGVCTGHNLTTGINNILMGANAGRNLPSDIENVVIIGDDILDLNTDQKNVTIIGKDGKFIIGETLFGQKINLREAIQGLLIQVADEIKESDGGNI